MDRCDRCAIAHALVTIHCPNTGGRLAFCAHCWRVVEKDARAAKFVILTDRRAELLVHA